MSSNIEQSPSKDTLDGEEVTLTEIEVDKELSKSSPQETESVAVGEGEKAPPPAELAPEISEVFKQIKDTIVKVSQDHMNEIVNELRNDVLRLEFIDKSGKLQIDRRGYLPMTIGMNKKVVKVGKLLRLLEADIEGMGEEGALDYGQLQTKFPSIFLDVPDAYDLAEGFGEIRANYIVGEKAKIYWAIDDVDNYSMHDLMIVESLYESRNQFAPSLPSSETQKQ